MNVFRFTELGAGEIAPGVKMFALQVCGLQFRSLKPTGELAEVGRVALLSHCTDDRG